MKRKEFNKDIAGKTPSELKLQAKTIAEELMKLRFRKSTGQLEQAFRVGHAKRELARVLTKLNATK